MLAKIKNSHLHISLCGLMVGEMPVLIISQNPITFLVSALPSVCERIAAYYTQYVHI